MENVELYRQAQMDILVREHVGKTFLSIWRYTGPFRLEKNLNHGEAMGMYEAELKYQQ